MLNSALRQICYALTPLFFLWVLISLACVLGYSILMIVGDVWTLNKTVSRITQILLVLSIFPLRRYLNLSWVDLGFAEKAVFFQQLGKGLFFGLLTLLPVILTLYVLNIQFFDESRTWTVTLLVKKSVISLLLALLIALVEESLFRGLLLGGLKSKMPVVVAILISATYYAALHFLSSGTVIPYENITLGNTFILFGQTLANWINPVFFPAFTGLLAVGIFLAVIRTRVKESLGICMGLHCSWVWQIKMTKEICNMNYDSPYLYLVSSYDGIVGPLVALWLFSATLLFWFYSRNLN